MIGWSNEENGKVDYVIGDTIELADGDLKYIYPVWGTPEDAVAVPATNQKAPNQKTTNQKVEQDIKVESISNKKAEDTPSTNFIGTIGKILENIVDIIVKLFTKIMPVVTKLFK